MNKKRISKRHLGVKRDGLRQISDNRRFNGEVEIKLEPKERSWNSRYSDNEFPVIEIEIKIEDDCEPEPTRLEPSTSEIIVTDISDDMPAKEAAVDDEEPSVEIVEKVESPHELSSADEDKPTKQKRRTRLQNSIAEKRNSIRFVRENAQKTDEEFVCALCNFKTDIKERLIPHIMTNHKNGNLFQCSGCTYTTPRRGNFMRHIVRHSKEWKRFACNKCDKTCPNSYELSKHMAIHDRIGSFACHLCKYKTHRQYYLNSHLLLHAGGNSFSCKHCDYRCSKHSNLKRHMRRHSNTCELNEEVEVGQDSLSSPTSSTKQDVTTSPGVTTISLSDNVPKDRRSLICEACDYRFPKRSSLIRHLKSKTHLRNRGQDDTEDKATLSSFFKQKAQRESSKREDVKCATIENHYIVAAAKLPNVSVVLERIDLPEHHAIKKEKPERSPDTNSALPQRISSPTTHDTKMKKTRLQRQSATNSALPQRISSPTTHDTKMKKTRLQRQSATNSALPQRISSPTTHDTKMKKKRLQRQSATNSVTPDHQRRQKLDVLKERQATNFTEFQSEKQTASFPANHSSEPHHSCDRCTSSDTNLGGIKHHSPTHNGFRYYTCNVCYCKASSLRELEEHQRDHKRDYFCQLCNYSTAQLKDLKTHVMAVHIL